MYELSVRFRWSRWTQVPAPQELHFFVESAGVRGPVDVLAAAGANVATVERALIAITRLQDALAAQGAVAQVSAEGNPALTFTLRVGEFGYVYEPIYLVNILLDEALLAAECERLDSGPRGDW